MSPVCVELSPKFIKKTFMYPGRLTWLAMDALGKYVSSLFKMLVAKKDDHVVKEACGYLQTMLHDHVPNRFAEELKIRILRRFEDTYLRMRDTYKCPDDYHAVAVDLFIAIIHESATSIECARDRGHLDVFDAYRIRYVDVVYSALPRLKNLRVLRLYGSTFLYKLVEIESFPPNLEECSLSMASDNDEVAKLRKCCKKLRSLDIDDQSCVTKRCIPDILQLECLEELHYDYCIKGDVLLGFECKKRACGKIASTFLKRFSRDMSGLGQQCVKSIPSFSPNLTSLTLTRVNLDLSPLKDLSQLKQFSVESRSYVHIRNLFSSIGSQLTCLSLWYIDDVDLEHVEKNCTSLDCLHLMDFPNTEDVSEREEDYPFELSDITVPKFPQVTRLELYYEEEYGPLIAHMLGGFVNLKKLQLHKWFDDEIFDAIVRRGVTTNLEQVILSSYYGPIMILDFSENYVVITESALRSGEGVRVRSMPITEYL